VTASDLRYVPDFAVALNGVPIPAAMRASITSITLQSGLEGADRVEMALSNDGLRWLDHPALVLDTPLRLSLGYATGPLDQVFVGQIVSQAPTFPADGAPTLTVAAQDKREQLQQGNNVRWFAIPAGVGNYPMPDLEVASLVAAEHLLIPIFDPIGAALSVLIGAAQYAVGQGDADEMQQVIRKEAGNDFEFLRKIARENGWEVLIDHSGPAGGQQLRFLSLLGNLTPDVTLKYGASLIDFTPRISNVGQILSVSATIWQPSIKMEFTINVGWDWDRQSLTLSVSPWYGASAGTAGQATTGSFTVVGEPLNLMTAPRVILGKLIPSLNSRLTGSGSTVGDPRIRAGGVLQLEGLGEQFGGLYRLTSVTHTIGSGGYRTSFEVRKEIWFGSIPLPQQGAVPIRVQGQQVA
jgi:phage protein D